MYDGVKTGGAIHSLRMGDVFWSRQRVLLRIVELVMLCTLSPPGKPSDGLLKAYRELMEEIYPDKKVDRENIEKAMMEKVNTLPKRLEVRKRNKRD